MKKNKLMELNRQHDVHLAQLNALTGKASFAESLAVVQSWKDSAASIETLTRTITELSEELAGLKAKGREAAAGGGSQLSVEQKKAAAKLGITDEKLLSSIAASVAQRKDLVSAAVAEKLEETRKARA